MDGKTAEAGCAARPIVVPRLQAELKLFRSALGHHALVVDGSRVYDLMADEAAVLRAAITPGDAAGSTDSAALLADLGLLAPAARRRIALDPIEPPKVTAFSLNVAQACNMGCAYCYADEGKFGGRPPGARLDGWRAAAGTHARARHRALRLRQGAAPRTRHRVLHHHQRDTAERSRRAAIPRASVRGDNQPGRHA